MDLVRDYDLLLRNSNSYITIFAVIIANDRITAMDLFFPGYEFVNLGPITCGMSDEVDVLDTNIHYYTLTLTDELTLGINSCVTVTVEDTALYVMASDFTAGNGIDCNSGSCDPWSHIGSVAEMQDLGLDTVATANACGIAGSNECVELTLDVGEWIIAVEPKGYTGSCRFEVVCSTDQPTGSPSQDQSLSPTLSPSHDCNKGHGKQKSNSGNHAINGSAIESANQEIMAQNDTVSNEQNSGNQFITIIYILVIAWIVTMVVAIGFCIAKRRSNNQDEDPVVIQIDQTLADVSIALPEKKMTLTSEGQSSALNEHPL
eukprot:159807_1